MSDDTEDDEGQDEAAETDGRQPERPQMMVALADGLCWLALMQMQQYGRWYIDVMTSTPQEDQEDGIPDLMNRLRYAASRGIMVFA